MLKASVILIIKDGLILSVSRKYNHNIWGLPGGKVEFGETPEQTVIRETKEETSIDVKEMSLLMVKEETSEKGLFDTYCFLASSWEGEPQSMEDGLVEWKTVDQLIGEEGAFPDYNRKVFDLLKNKHPSIIIK